jgi:hypothetical protein
MPFTAGRLFGFSVAAGDFNNDGKEDLAIGSPGYDGIVIEGDGPGSVAVLYGTSGGLQVNSPAAQSWNQDKPNVDNEAENGDHFGTSLVVGDFNNDGKVDLAIGVPGEDIGDATDSGAVNVLHGTSAGLRATSPADQFWHQGKPGVEDTEEDGDGFGSLSSGRSSFDL